MNWVRDQAKLHITIGSVPQTKTVGTAAQIDLRNDLQMIKAALLYADHAKLCSIASSALLSILAFVDIPKDKRWEFLQTLNSWGVVDEDTQKMMSVLSAVYDEARRRRFSKRGRTMLQEFDEALAGSWEAMTNQATSVVSGFGADGVVQAVESGVLEVHKFDSVLERTVQESKHRDFVLEYVGVVSEAVSDAHTYPLFDEDTSEVISAGIASGVIPVSDSGIARGKQIGLAADLFAKLPLFPDASVKEILEIRREVEVPLLRFRAAMVKFSENIKNAAWDKEFPADAEQVFGREVAPAILDIEEAAKSNRFITELAQRLVPAGGVALSALAISMSNLPHAAVAALAIGATVGSATVIQAYRGWAEKRQTTEQNHLYFYYKAGQFLADGTYEYVSDKVK